MLELIVNDIVDNQGLKQYIVLDELTVLENYEKVFGEPGMIGIYNSFRIYKRTSFYEIKRYFQFVGILKYTNNPKSLTMSLFDISDMDNYLDSFTRLSSANWRPEQLNQIGDIYQEILNDKFKELVSIRLVNII